MNNTFWLPRPDGGLAELYARCRNCNLSAPMPQMTQLHLIGNEDMLYLCTWCSGDLWLVGVLHDEGWRQ
jgi:hypothetical protein